MQWFRRLSTRHDRQDTATARDPKYHDRILNEIRHYTELLDRKGDSGDVQGCLPDVSVFSYAMQRYRPYLASCMAHLSIDKYLVERQGALGRRLNLLSLGCGGGEWEIAVARSSSRQIDVHLVDLSIDLMRKAENVGGAEGIRVETSVEDVNEFRIAPKKYDFVVCRSSLHHFVKLDDLMARIAASLTDDGQFIVFGEWIGRNGLQIYPDTERVAQSIFDTLPQRLRLNRYTNEVDSLLPNIDHSVNSFEAICSEDIMPAIFRRFDPVEHVTYDAFLSLLLDFRYGPNYDVSSEEDRKYADTIIDADINAIRTGILKPTAMQGIFEPQGRRAIKT